MDDLVARLRRQEPSALAELYDSMSRRAFGLAMRILHDEPAAADVVQEAFTWVWERADRLDARRGRAEALLLTIVHHRAIDAARRRQRLESRSRPIDDAGFLADTAAGEEPESDFEQRFQDVRASLQNLPDEQRAILTQVYFEGLTQVEVAARSGVPLGTVKSRLRLGLDKLRGTVGASRT